MITGTHAIVYARDPGQARAFFRDVLGLPGVVGLYEPAHLVAYDL
jgi:catechol 2,3-dioxygenase-like lactoylglutathione lyase family enzyme